MTGIQMEFYLIFTTVVAFVNGIERVPNILDPNYLTKEDLNNGNNNLMNAKYSAFSSIYQQDKEIYIGAKNTLLRIGSDDMKVKWHKKWENKDSLKFCQLQQGGDDCNNYIKSIYKQGEYFILCGTMNMYPRVVIFKSGELDSINFNNNSEETREVCGTSMNYPMTNYVLNNDLTKVSHNSFEIYTGITGYHDNEMSHISWISRLVYQIKPLKLMREKSTRTRHSPRGSWINDADFISSFDYSNYLYFVFREKSKRKEACDTGAKENHRIMISRVCMGDQTNGLFQSYSQMQLQCIYRENSFSNIIINYATKTWLSRGTNILYIIANDNDNKIQGVCTFNFEDIHKRFNENKYKRWYQGENFYKLQYGDMKITYNGRICSNVKFNETKSETYDEEELFEMKTYSGTMSLKAGKGKNFTNIFVDPVRTKNDGVVDVLFITENDGNMYRYVKDNGIRSRSSSFCLLGGWQVSDNENPVHKIVQDKFATDKIYVLTQNRIWRLQTSKCEIFNKEDCISTPEPYCVWDDALRCHSDTDTTRYLLKNGQVNKKKFSNIWNRKDSKCVILKFKVDGGWSELSEGTPCELASMNGSFKCNCSKRTCTNPTPMNGGRDCIGESTHVQCIEPSKWSKWSKWTTCSQTCLSTSLTSKRYQSRVCVIGNDGLSCVGESHNVQICSELPACPEGDNINLGDLETWSKWSPCTSNCSSVIGMQSRFRICKKRNFKHTNVICKGDSKQMRTCSSTRICNTDRETSIQDKWMKQKTNHDGSYLKIAYRSLCKYSANTLIPNLQKIVINCSSTNSCGMAEYITVDKAYLDRKVYEDFQENKDEKPEDIHMSNRIRHVMSKEENKNMYLVIYISSLLSFIAGGVICVAIVSYCKRDRRSSTERYFSGNNKEKPRCQPNHYSVEGSNLIGDPRKYSRRETETEENEYTKPPCLDTNESITVQQATLKRNNLLRHSSSARNSSPAALLLKGHKNWRDEEP